MSTLIKFCFSLFQLEVKPEYLKDCSNQSLVLQYLLGKIRRLYFRHRTEVFNPKSLSLCGQSFSIFNLGIKTTARDSLPWNDSLTDDFTCFQSARLDFFSSCTFEKPNRVYAWIFSRSQPFELVEPSMKLAK